MPASAGLHCRRHCRRDIAGAQDKVSDRGIPEQCCKLFPSVDRGLPLVVLKLYPELHSGIPPGRGLLKVGVIYKTWRVLNLVQLCRETSQLPGFILKA
ncbi:unnamed protein product [Staurois parvus]|uniref:Uncharacterized protein n=1 Tax=Staurois parvus TaxID=386267 RepID=A0ABN9FQW1_9NEOB|nr:unnamed protein product [Staurois parvus]